MVGQPRRASARARTGRAALTTAVSLLLAAFCAPLARAASVAPTTLTQSVVVPGQASRWIGNASLAVSLSATTFSASLSAPAVYLGKGNRFRIWSCLKTRVIPGLPASACSSRDLDTRAKTGTEPYAAPSVSQDFKRPAAGGSGYVSSQVIVDIWDVVTAKYLNAATSWPVAGLAEAAVAVPVVGETTAKTPVSEGVDAKSGAVTGGLNTGARDSTCHGNTRAGQPTPADASTTVLGLMPALYEVREPSGQSVGQAAKGVVLLLHGGGWFNVGPAGIEAERANADRWRARGWRTVNATYRACAYSFLDAAAFMSKVTAKWPGLPSCVTGSSAGAYNALWVAANNQDVDCVVARGAPTDPAALHDQLAPDYYIHGGTWTEGPRVLQNWMTAAAGYENLPGLTIGTRPLHAKILLGIAAGDWLIPWEQATSLQARMLAVDPAQQVDTVQLDAGVVPWVHAGVSTAVADDFNAREAALMDLVAP